MKITTAICIMLFTIIIVVIPVKNQSYKLNKVSNPILNETKTLHKESNPIIDEAKVKELAWIQLSKELIKEISQEYFFDNTSVSTFIVTPEYNNVQITEHTIPFEYDEYKERELFLVIYKDKADARLKPLLIFIDPLNDKLIGVKKGYFLIERCY